MINDENTAMKALLKFEKLGEERNAALVFVHGWPDDQSLWDKEFHRFAKTHCCIRITLPNCGEQLDRRWGVDFPELVALMSRTIAQVLPDHRRIIFYFYMWRAIMFSKKYRSSLIGRYRPGCPILYFYGKRKPYNFHSQQWEMILASSPGSKVVAVPKAGHWLMLDQHAFVATTMERWLGT